MSESFLKVKGEIASQDTGLDYNESGNKFFGSGSAFATPSSSSNIKKVVLFTAVCVGLIFIVKRVK